MKSEDRQWIDQQIEYYRRRAAEYDVTSTPEGDPLARHSPMLEEALSRFAPRGKVLELASGTGQRTLDLVRFDVRITALDSSPEMLELNQRKVRDPKVRYIAADLFSWEPDDRYDVVFFGFWLSHVPMSRFKQFWDLVAECLAPSGRVFFVDETRAADWRGEEFLEETGQLVRRRLQDGSEHRAVKIFWEADDLERRLRSLGWDITVRSTGAFYWGEGRLSSPQS